MSKKSESLTNSVVFSDTYFQELHKVLSNLPSKFNNWDVKNAEEKTIFKEKLAAIDKKTAISAANSKYSAEYLKGLEEIESLDSAYTSRKLKLAEEIRNLQKENDDINAELLVEFDEDKITALVKRKADNSLAIETKKEIARHSNADDAVKQRFENLINGQIGSAASKEFSDYSEMIESEIDDIRIQSEAEINALREVLNNHPYAQGRDTRIAIKIRISKH